MANLFPLIVKAYDGPPKFRDYPHTVAGSLGDGGDQMAGHGVILLTHGTATVAGFARTDATGAWSFSGLPLGTGKLCALAYHPDDSDAVAAGIVTPFLPGDAPAFVAQLLQREGTFADNQPDDGPPPWEFSNALDHFSSYAGGSMTLQPVYGSAFIGNGNGDGGRAQYTARQPFGYGWNLHRINNGEAEILLQWAQANGHPDDTGAMGIQFLNIDGDLMTGAAAEQTAYADDSGWHERELIVPVPAGAVTYRLIYDTGLVAGGSANSFASDVRVTLRPVA